MTRFTPAAFVLMVAIGATNWSAAVAGKPGGSFQKSGNNGMKLNNSNSGSSMRSYSRMMQSSSKPLGSTFSSTNTHNNMQQFSSRQKPMQFKSTFGNHVTMKGTGKQPFHSSVDDSSHPKPHKTGDSTNSDDHHHHGHHHHHSLPWWAITTVRRPSIVIQQPVVVRRPVYVQRQQTISAPDIVVTSATEPPIPQVTPGSQVSVVGSELGETNGQVMMRVNALTLPVEIVAWTNSSVTLQIPEMTLTSSTPSQIAVVRADGTLVRTVEVALVPNSAKEL